ncbi:NAD(P)-dependent oxidoreductase [Mycolicibacter senuensis]|jgi:3-hydroxyisobutyrate dehydrogenase-like beta-hydroxyacid dehydrogenase|uniref:6-phosphogluconate dehydrogenase n=1 Tax=Mycolicibacter senuensis TaxID=386913 RepID=A0A7I9XT28_9MYCO|nr:NAD(P)-dependent oxidoreductase [Mycolicibacter senuensis]MDQ2625718.1 NAD(P)-dependent oxidoreductase [Actinomycetota bacterium]ORW67252.1 6-phosphogluconate dehydrogenase [Mycolicibacter senuensis]GFG72427.1 6-phosphogluconate dehydrogenase [Mycolicibacter senuensis]
MRVGFIGLGSQGAPMARRIIEGGYSTTLWARRAGTLESFADTEARVADSPADLGRASDLVCLCVVGDADVEQVVQGENGVLAGMQSGGIIAIHSTVHPDTCRRLAQHCADRGVAVIDAPVSGGGPAAEAGTLLVMAGGDEDVVQRCRPVFETYADPVVHLGGLGSGQLTKLLNNLLFTANLGTAVTALALGEQLGVSRERLAEVVSRGSSNSFALNSVRGSGGTLDRLAGLAGSLLQKDVRLVADLAQQAAATPGAVLDAADAALSLMNHPR